MNNDLKIIKKKYGESMAKFCRESFSSLLEEENLVPKILANNFNPSHDLYKDIEKYGLKEKFKNYIFNIIEREKQKEQKLTQITKTPKELMSEAGYNLYECKSEEDIQYFKKYYAKGEEICTFDGERLHRCRVFFAVKKDVDYIKREYFINPKRQDLYGTSVISIQFTRDPYHFLSIKNRYNHTVFNPDATFSNNLDNIIPGLTESFEREYGLRQRSFDDEVFEIPNYIIANDGKYYKYNNEIENIYYCPNNIIIENGKIKRIPKEKYILLDYYLLDLRSGNIWLYDDELEDSFPDTIKNIQKIKIENKKDEKIIYLTQKKGEEIEITIDKQNRIIGLKNNNITEIGDDFLFYNEVLKKIELKKVQIIGNDFLYNNRELTNLNTPLLKECGYDFLWYNTILEKIYLPFLQRVDDCFLMENNNLTEVYLPSLVKIEEDFLRQNKTIKKFIAPNLKEIGDEFMVLNNSLTELYLPSLEEVGRMFLWFNNSLIRLRTPNLKKCKHNFLSYNETLKEIDISNLQYKGENFLYRNKNILNNNIVEKTKKYKK